MLIRKLLLFLLLVDAMVSSASGQVGCPGPGACTNPVAPALAIGVWTRSGETYTLTTTPIISGKVKVDHPVPTCPDVTYRLSGVLNPLPTVNNVQGTAEIDIVATDPNPSTECGGWTPVSPVSIDGYVLNNSNDRITGSFHRPDPDGPGTISYPITLSKFPTDPVVSETTRAVGFSSDLLQTVGQFRQTLENGMGYMNRFTGRQVFETTGPGTAIDTCWFPGSSVPKWTGVQGSKWNVGYYFQAPPWIYTLDEWVDDYIGWNRAQVDYYRRMLTPNSFPCYSSIPQQMSIYVNGHSGTSTVYLNHTVGSELTLGQVKVYRGTVQQTTNYVTPPL